MGEDVSKALQLVAGKLITPQHKTEESASAAVADTQLLEQFDSFSPILEAPERQWNSAVHSRAHQHPPSLSQQPPQKASSPTPFPSLTPTTGATATTTTPSSPSPASFPLREDCTIDKTVYQNTWKSLEE